MNDIFAGFGVANGKWIGLGKIIKIRGYNYFYCLNLNKKFPLTNLVKYYWVVIVVFCIISI